VQTCWMLVMGAVMASASTTSSYTTSRPSPSTPKRRHTHSCNTIVGDKGRVESTEGQRVMKVGQRYQKLVTEMGLSCVLIMQKADLSTHQFCVCEWCGLGLCLELPQHPHKHITGQHTTTVHIDTHIHTQ
jgi:hypothetical protein